MNTKEVSYVRCHKCHCFRLPVDFLNHKKRKLKTCQKCRLLGVKSTRTFVQKQKALRIEALPTNDNDNENNIVHLNDEDVKTNIIVDACVNIINEEMKKELAVYKALLDLKDKTIRDLLEMKNNQSV